jgi:hypothetical protein
VAEVVRSEWARPWGLVTLGWLQNGAGWGNISAADRVYLEIFEDVRRQDAPDLSLAEYAARCVEHAVAEGVPRDRVGLCLGAYPVGGYRPRLADYRPLAAAAVCVYAGDDVGYGRWEEWLR